jgi:hypothetical protein
MNETDVKEKEEQVKQLDVRHDLPRRVAKKGLAIHCQMDLLSRKAVFLDCGHTTHLYFRGGILFGIRKETMTHLIVLQRYYTREQHRSEPIPTAKQQASWFLPRTSVAGRKDRAPAAARD